jgi:hypothetical protein
MMSKIKISVNRLDGLGVNRYPSSEVALDDRPAVIRKLT